jgi:hypothetical protein
MSTVTVTAVELVFVEGASDRTLPGVHGRRRGDLPVRADRNVRDVHPRKQHGTPEKAAAASERNINGKQ